VLYSTLEKNSLTNLRKLWPEEDVISVVILAIKLRLALKLALQLVTIVAKKAMSLEIAKRQKNPKSVTGVVRKATFLVIALVIPAVEEAVEEAEMEVENVSNVEKSGISLVHAPILLVMVEGTVHSVAAMVRGRLVIHVAA